MKLILLLFALSALGISGNAATVSGTLTNTTTSAAIPYYRIYLIDSSATSIIYRDSAFTDAAGSFTFAIPGFITTGNMIVWVQACGSRIANSIAFSGSNLTLNLAACSSSTATISGYVAAHGGGSLTRPVYNKAVYIVDSTAAHYNMDSVFTEYDGHFSYIVPAGFTSGALRFYTLDVVTSPSVKVSYSGVSISGLFLQVSYRKHALWGKTTLSGAPNNGPTKLYLILKAYDPGLMDTTLTALDSFNTIGNTGCFNKEYDSSACSLTGGGANFLLVKAAVMPTHTSYATCLPAYSYNSLNWNGASRIDSCNGPQYGSAYKMSNIDLPIGVNPGGPGFIGGSVLLGANKASGAGDPLSGKMLLLTTAGGQAVGFTYSNSGGKFSFSNLATGSYLIFGDAWGKHNPPLAVTISAASPNVSNVIFEESSNEFKGHYNTLGFSAQPGLASVALYPNPACSYIFLQGLSDIDGDKEIVLRDVRGLILSHTHMKAGSSAGIPTSQLPAGMYILQVQTTQGAANYRFVK